MMIGIGLGLGMTRGPGVAAGPTLAALSLDNASIFYGVPITINILGATTGSTITGSVPAGLTLNSGARTITGTPTLGGTYNFDLIETLAGSPNSPRTNPVTLEVYSPTSLGAKLEFWADFSDFTTMFQDTAGATPVTAVGQRVARINDKSGLSNNGTQATTAAQPILRFDAGTGTYYGECDGLDDRLVFPCNQTVNFDRITVARQITWTLNDQLWGMGSTGLPELRQAPTATLGLAIVAIGGGTPGNTNLPVGTTGIITEQFTLSPATFSLQINNTTAVTASSGTPVATQTSMSLGARTNGTLAGNFRVYETVVADSLTASELNQLKNYFAARHGVTL